MCVEKLISSQQSLIRQNAKIVPETNSVQFFFKEFFQHSHGETFVFRYDADRTSWKI